MKRRFEIWRVWSTKRNYGSQTAAVFVSPREIGPRRTDSRLRGNGQLGNVQMTRIPVIILPDVKVVIASAILAVAGGCKLLRKT